MKIWKGLGWMLLFLAFMFFIGCFIYVSHHDALCKQQCVAEGFDGGVACRGETQCRCTVGTVRPQKKGSSADPTE